MIELKNIYAGYEEKEVLQDISMTFEPGKITVLVGPNGCGKSTLLKTIVGLLRYESGEVWINGTSAAQMKPVEIARKVSYLPQNKKAPELSVLKMVLHGRFPYLGYPRKYREQDIKKARESLAWAGLEHAEEELVSHLSGGMQQNVYIAMALTQDTETILMDEPTTYLDVASQLRLMKLVQKMKQEGKAVVMVLHDLPQALQIADKIIVLKEGKAVFTGDTETVYESGILQDVFGVEVIRVQTEKGLRYFCESLQKEE